MRFTVARRSDGAFVGKKAYVEDGRIERSPEGKRHPDRFEVVAADSARGLADLVRGLRPHQLVVAGVPRNGATSGEIVLKANRRDGEVALSKDDFAWPDGPGVLMLDFDRKDESEGWRPGLPDDQKSSVDAIEAVAPGLLDGFVIAPSSSSHLSAEGAEPTGLRGFHILAGVVDASDIPRAGKVLAARLVLAGFGYAFVSKAGHVEVRTLVDEKVWGPQHPLFLGGVQCVGGVSQRRGIGVRDGGLADTAVVLPDLTEEERVQFEATCRQLVGSAGPLSERRRGEWARGRVEEMVARGVARDMAERRVRSAAASVGQSTADGYRILDEHAEILTARGYTTVGEVLANPAEWAGVACADPLEPDYGTGVGQAKIFVDGDSAYIHSFCHGEWGYLLRRSAASEFDDFDEGAGVDDRARDPTSDAGSEGDLSTTGNKSATAATRDKGADAVAHGSRMRSGAAGVRSAADLMRREFPAVEWAVDGLLPRGCWLLAGKAKTGKSWFVLDLLIATATGRPFLGRQVSAGEVLYLALEDNDRRMQNRIGCVAAGLPPNALADFHYQTEWPTGEEAVAHLRRYLTANPNTRVVVVDTLARVKQDPKRNATAYDSDYAAIAPFQALAAAFNVTVVLVTHLRKAPSEDPFDDITGSAAMFGAVDGALILRRRSGSQELELFIRGRDSLFQTRYEPGEA